MKRRNSAIKFIGLHAHSVAGSIFDAIGYPQDHMDFAYENGMEALALTDHGNMNGLAYQVLHARKMKEEGKDFMHSGHLGFILTCPSNLGTGLCAGAMGKVPLFSA